MREKGFGFMNKSLAAFGRAALAAKPNHRFESNHLIMREKGSE